MNGNVPGSEPGDKAPENPPPADGGAFFVSPLDYFKRHKDLSKAISLQSYKKTAGISVRFVGSLSTNITRGHQHNTTLGYARSIVFIIENKMNVGAVFAWVREGRHEETSRNRSEFVVGVKYERYDSDRTLHEASQTTNDDMAVRSRKTKIIEQHITELERLVAVSIKDDIKNFFEEHEKMEALLKTQETQVSKQVTDVRKWIEKADSLKAKFDTCKQECQKTDAKYSGNFKAIASAAFEITTKGKKESSMKGEARLMSDSLIKVAAALTKAG